MGDRKVFDEHLVFLDKAGQALMGDYWKTVYFSIQDAIAPSPRCPMPQDLN